MTHHQDTPPPVDRSLKVPHLVFGLLFLGIAGIWAVGQSGVIAGKDLAVLGPAVLILAGVIGLAASLASGRNKRRALHDGYGSPYADPYADPYAEDSQLATDDAPSTTETPRNDDDFGDTAPITEEK
ncbi:MAG: hypothetical protein JOZ82_05735 [Marmoricola sp.]|nr:hypothetical protein [Marmoricola sp.]